jgi:hypothetical protein
MSPKEFAEKDSEKLFEDDEVLFIRAKGFPAIDYYGGDFLKTNYYSYRRNTIYLIVGKGKKKSYVIFVPEYGSPSVQDYDGKIYDFGDIIKDYPQMEIEVLDIIGSDSVYGVLKLIKSGKKFDKYDLNKVDECLDSFVFNEKTPGKSMINLAFTESEYFEFFDFNEGEWDRSILSNLFSGYDLDIYSSDSAYEDWKEGYILGSINDENAKLLDNILAFISPDLNELKKTDRDQYWIRSSMLLSENFSRQADDIENEYYTLRNQAASDEIEKTAIIDLADAFQEYGIIKKYTFTSYYTTVNLLLSLYSGRDKTLSIKELFEEVGKDLNIHVGSYNEVGYEAYGFDGDEFNRTVESSLQSILDKIEDEPEKYEGAKKYAEVLYKLNKLGYEIGRNYELPYDKEKTFRIQSVNMTDAKIIIREWNKKIEGNNKSFSFEEFVNYLQSPELFESIVRKLKKML